MTRNEYRAYRKSIRQNGLYALRWMPLEHAAQMMRIVRPAGDYMELRAWFAADIRPDRIRAHPAQLVRPTDKTRTPRAANRHTI